MSLMAAIAGVQFAAIPGSPCARPWILQDREELETRKHEILLLARTMLGLRGPDGGLTMATLIEKTLEIREIPNRGAGYRGASRSNPSRRGRWAGGAILAFQLYVWASGSPVRTSCGCLPGRAIRRCS